MPNGQSAVLRDPHSPRPLLFLATCVALAIPFGLAGVLTGGAPFVLELPVSVLLIVVPAAAATMFAAVDRSGVGNVWRGLFRWKSTWRPWIAAVLLPPAVLAAYLISCWFISVAHDGPATPLAQLPVLFALYLVAAMLEEIGWTGYATAPLVERFGIQGASATIGIAWAAVHWIPWAAMGHEFHHIVAMSGSTLVLRFLITWLFMSGGSCLPVAIVLHAGSNTAQSYPNGLANSDPWLWFLALILVSALAALVRFMIRRDQPIG